MCFKKDTAGTPAASVGRLYVTPENLEKKCSSWGVRQVLSTTESNCALGVGLSGYLLSVNVVL